jgi:hypothetical protein
LSKERYMRLIEDFCRLAQLDDPLRIIHGGPVEVGDVAFSLIYSEKINPDAVLIYCEYGTAPAAQETDAYRVLLQKNLAQYDGNGAPTFSLSAATGRVLCANRLLLDRATPQELSKLLAAMADQAKRWRHDYRLNAHQHGQRPERFTRPRFPDA